jgi:hypothetical protein
MPGRNFVVIQTKPASTPAVKIGPQTFPKSPKMMEICVDANVDYETEYKSLQVLFEAISMEADLLRDQLVLILMETFYLLFSRSKLCNQKRNLTKN